MNMERLYVIENRPLCFSFWIFYFQSLRTCVMTYYLRKDKTGNLLRQDNSGYPWWRKWSNVSIRGHSKSRLAWNFQFLTHFLPMFVPVVRFSELPTHPPPPPPPPTPLLPPSQITFHNACEFSNEKSGSEKRKDFFL